MAVKYNDELRDFLYQSYPSVPFTEKKKAKEFFSTLSIFEKHNDRSWLDSLPKTVLSSFITFFVRKQIEGIIVDGLDELKADQDPLVDRIKRFIARHEVETKRDLMLDDVDVAGSRSSTINEVINSSNDHDIKRVRAEETKKSIMVVLVGLPGSGKSTFCQNLANAIGVGVERLCQDELGKAACERGAHAGMEDGGKVILVDRTNLNAEQRSTWVNIAKRYKCAVIAAVFNVPEEICIERAKQRTSHTLAPGQATMVIKRLLKSSKPINKDEGFDAIFESSSSNASTELLREITAYVNLAWGNRDES